MTDVMPDLSHLTEEERQIIERVLQRQKVEESQEQELKHFEQKFAMSVVTPCMFDIDGIQGQKSSFCSFSGYSFRKYEKQLRDIEKQIEERMEVARKLVGTMDDAICQICQKTKFADGIGHKCYYCQLRSCARCGGRLQIKVKADQVKPGNLPTKDKSPTGSATQQKTIWSCSLCQQRQQILAKTGKWFYSGDKDRASSEEPPLLPAESPGATAALDRPVTPVQRGQEGLKADQRQQEAKKDAINDQGRLEDEEKRTAGSVVSSEQKVPSPRDARHDLSASPANNDRWTSKGTNALQRRQSLQDRRYTVTNEQSDRDTRTDQAREQRRESGAKSVTRKTSKERRGSVAPDTVSPVSQNATVHQKAHIGKVKNAKELEGTQRRRHRSPSAAGSSESGADQLHYTALARGRPEKYREDRSDQIRSLKEMSGEYRPPDGSTLPFTRDRMQPSSHYGQTSRRRSRPLIVNSTKERSLSSSDEDLPSTSECQSYEDMESESYSDRGELGRSLHSAVEPNAHITSGRQLPLQWQSSPDGTYIYRRVVLHRHAGTSLGLKVVGGRSTPTGRLGAFITKVKRGSVADITGRLVPGDEVLEWNGQSLQNASFDEVCNAINQSKFSNRIDLVVARSVVQPSLAQNEYPFSLPGFAPELQTAVMAGSSISLPTIASTIAGGTIGGQTPIVMITAPLSEVLQLKQQQQQLSIPSVGASRSKGQIFGQISISILYIPEARQLMVNLLEAVDLPPRADGTARNPYVKMFLLPDRSEKSRRQSKTMAETCHPVWHQTMLYRDVSEMDIEQKIIEITVWDYDQYSSNDFLGEVLVDLSNVELDGTTAWYTLIDMDEETALRKKLRQTRAHFAASSYSTTGSLTTYCSQEDVRPESNIAHPVMKPSMFATQARRRRYEANYGGRLMHHIRSGYRSDSGLAMQPAAGRPYYEQPQQARGYDSEELEERGFEPEAHRLSGYYSDYGEHQRSSQAYQHQQQQQQQQRTGWRQWQGSETMERRAMIPLELRPSSPTEESGNETSSPSHPNLRHLPRPPSKPITERTEKMPPLNTDRSRPLNRDMDLRRFVDQSLLNRYTSGKTAAAEQRGRLRNRANFISGDYLSDESETSASLPSAHCEQPADQSQKFRDDRLKGFALESFVAPELTDVPSCRDGSPEEEALSAQLDAQENISAHSRSIADDQFNQPEGSEAAFFETSMEGGAYKSAPSNSVDSMTTAEKRKKSLMNRLIPGRSNASQSMNGMCFVVTSDEVGVPPNLSPQTSFDITKQSSRESTDSNESSLVPKVQEQGSIGEFVEGLGPGQVVGRQAIASPCLGEIFLTISERNGNLEVKVVRAKHLARRTGSKFYPSPYVKVYLCNEKSVVAKAKTGLAARTPEPRFDQLLIFTEPYQNRLLQVTVVGDYGRMERKSLIGVAMIKLGHLDLSKSVEGWYKLYQNG
ncbi:regulating synaptic membrane exocytosis 2 [Trichuris trichiura]|uniref:Regulating synaptic membrane exocytosis 2 n=1 Tax=Trichuris trichiura TaxID=36087 RepID=A0A077Z2L6_TRITR|nr:regulating synaptic membrane exocytosis 2 [Trichuris trichiura]